MNISIFLLVTTLASLHSEYTAIYANYNTKKSSVESIAIVKGPINKLFAAMIGVS